jgi:hypothetical protein
MRRSGVPLWEVAAQLGHSVGKEHATTGRYAFYSPDYRGVEALGALIGPGRGPASYRPVRRKK